jgi:hypothetical protein
MVKEPGSNPWSSCRATAGVDREPDVLAADWILNRFGEDRPQTRKSCQCFVIAGLGLESPWKNLKGQCLLGDDALLGQLAPLLKGKRSQKSLAANALPADRPWRRCSPAPEAVQPVTPPLSRVAVSSAALGRKWPPQPACTI